MAILISRGAQHAIKALVRLSELPAGGAMPVHELAQHESIPPSFLSKVVRRLVEAGVLDATRGRRGGVRLAQDPADISLLTVMEAVDGERASAGCLLGRERCRDAEACSVHRAWKRIRDDLTVALSRISLAEVTGPPSPGGPHKQLALYPPAGG